MTENERLILIKQREELLDTLRKRGIRKIRGVPIEDVPDQGLKKLVDWSSSKKSKVRDVPYYGERLPDTVCCKECGSIMTIDEVMENGKTCLFCHTRLEA